MNERITEILVPFGLSELAMAELKEAMEKIQSDGFVRKELYKEKLAELKELRESLSAAFEDLATANAYKTQYNEVREAYEEYKRNQLEETQRAKIDGAIAGRLMAEGANPRLASLLLKEIRIEDIKTSLREDGSVCIENWETVSEKLKNTYPDAFGTVAERGARVAVPPVRGAVSANPWVKDTVSLDEQTRLYRENPALARTLAENAGVVLR